MEPEAPFKAFEPERESLGIIALVILALIVIELAMMNWAGGRYRSEGVDYVALISLPIWLVIFGVLIAKCRLRAIPLIVAIVVVQGGGWGVLSLLNFARKTAISAHCGMRLHVIGQALQAYYRKHGTFPPAYVADASGRPLHSWRTLILPYGENSDLSEKIDLGEPWDGPRNRSLCQTPVSIYRCPSDKAQEDSATTSYVAVVGEHTAWPGTTGSKLSDFKDGPENTILLVEIVNSSIPWAKPHDLHVGQMPVTVGPPGPSSPHPRNGFWALFADGSVRYLRADLDEATYWALLSRDGGEDVDPKDCDVVFPPDHS